MQKPKSKSPINENTYIIKILSDIWKEDIAENISQIIDTLSENEKRVIIERYKNGKTYREIAEELKCSSANIQRIQYNALRKIRISSSPKKLAIFCKKELEMRDELLIKINEYGETIKKMQEAILKQSLTDIEQIRTMVAMQIEISDINFSTKAKYRLIRNGIETLGQLSELTQSDLLEMRNIGNAICNEICDKAKEYGIVIRRE